MDVSLFKHDVSYSDWPLNSVQLGRQTIEIGSFKGPNDL
jgi:hypothetical protein